MRIRWTSSAAADLENIHKYLQENYPHLANSTLRKIYARISTLKKSPFRGRSGRRQYTRELILTPLPYVVAY